MFPEGFPKDYHAGGSPDITRAGGSSIGIAADSSNAPVTTICSEFTLWSGTPSSAFLLTFWGGDMSIVGVSCIRY